MALMLHVSVCRRHASLLTRVSEAVGGSETRLASFRAAGGSMLHSLGVHGAGIG